MKHQCCKNKKSNGELNITIDFLKVISEENRIRILCILQRQEMCVCEIWQFLDLPQNLTSHHLKILEKSKLVKSRKEGLKVIYSLNKKVIKKHYSLLSHFINNYN